MQNSVSSVDDAIFEALLELDALTTGDYVQDVLPAIALLKSSYGEVAGSEQLVTAVEYLDGLKEDLPDPYSTYAGRAHDVIEPFSH